MKSKKITINENTSIKKILNHSNDLFESEWFYVDFILPKSFIEKYEDKINWEYIIQHQALSESLIKKYQNKFDWRYIARYQKLSNKFIAKHWDKLELYYLKLNKNLNKIKLMSFLRKEKLIN